MGRNGMGDGGVGREIFAQQPTTYDTVSVETFQSDQLGGCGSEGGGKGV